MQKLILVNFQSPGDLVTLTAAVRDLHTCYPNQFITDVRTGSPELWEQNPYVTPLDVNDPEVRVLECHYPLIQFSNQRPVHFLHGFIEDLNDRRGNRQPTADHSPSPGERAACLSRRLRRRQGVRGNKV